MIKIPLQDIVNKIKQEKGISEEEINKKIDSKLHQLSGLISKEGAAHIIANELGVRVFEQTSGRLQIKNILSGMRSVETLGKVTNVFELREFKTGDREGKVANIVIADATGRIRVVMWGEQAENIKKIKEGDIIKIVGGYVRENQNRPEIHMNERSKLILNPEGETISNIAEAEQRAQAQRKAISDISEPMENIELLGTIVQAFDPKFFEVCPNCGKRARPEGSSFVCQQHGSVSPDYSYVMNLILDDGTETMRCTFFRNQAERLLEKTKEQMLQYKDNPQSFDQLKTSLLGNIVKLVGRVNKNEMFDRLEFITQLVFNKPNPEDEIKRLDSENKSSKEKDPVEAQEEEIIAEIEDIN